MTRFLLAFARLARCSAPPRSLPSRSSRPARASGSCRRPGWRRANRSRASRIARTARCWWSPSLGADLRQDRAGFLAPKQMRAGGMEEIVARDDCRCRAARACWSWRGRRENGIAMRKWALLARTDDLTVRSSSRRARGGADAYPDAALRAALASVVVRAKLPPDEMLAVLPYRLDDLGGFRLMRASPDGTAVLTLGPTRHDAAGRAALFHDRAACRRAAAAAERDRFAQRTMTGIPAAGRTCAS